MYVLDCRLNICLSVRLNSNLFVWFRLFGDTTACWVPEKSRLNNFCECYEFCKSSDSQIYSLIFPTILSIYSVFLIIRNQKHVSCINESQNNLQRVFLWFLHEKWKNINYQFECPSCVNHTQLHILRGFKDFFSLVKCHKNRIRNIKILDITLTLIIFRILLERYQSSPNSK